MARCQKYIEIIPSYTLKIAGLFGSNVDKPSHFYYIFNPMFGFVHI